MLFRSKRENEKVKAGYYAVHLDRYGIDVELAATERVGLHKYTFPQANDAAIVFNLADALNWDKTMDAYLTLENDTTISGYRYSKGWANDQKLYFTAEFSKPMKGIELYDGDKLVEGKELTSAKLYAKVLFETQDKEDILVRVALSPVSIENAKLNMQAELTNWDFDKVVKDADEKWNNELHIFSCF